MKHLEDEVGIDRSKYDESSEDPFEDVLGKGSRRMLVENVCSGKDDVDNLIMELVG